MKTPDNTQRIEKMLKSNIRKHKICDIVGAICAVLFVAFFVSGFIMIPLAIWGNSQFILYFTLSFFISWICCYFLKKLTRKMGEYYQSIQYQRRVLDLRSEPERYIYEDFEEKIKERML